MKTAKTFRMMLLLLLALPATLISCGDDDKDNQVDNRNDLSTLTDREIAMSIYDAVDEIQKNLPTGTLTNYVHKSKFGSGTAIVNGTVQKSSSYEKFECTVELKDFSQGEGKGIIRCTGTLKFTQQCFPSSTKMRASRNVSFTNMKVESSKVYDIVSGGYWKDSDVNAYASNICYEPYSGKVTGQSGIEFSFSYKYY